MGSPGDFQHGEYREDRWITWFGQNWIRLKLYQPTLSNKKFASAIGSNYVKRNTVSNDIVTKWLAGKSTPEPKMIFATGEAFRSYGVATSGLEALYGAGRFIDAARLLREFAISKPNSAVFIFCRLPGRLDWVEYCSSPISINESIDPSHLARLRSLVAPQFTKLLATTWDALEDLERDAIQRIRSAQLIGHQRGAWAEAAAAIESTGQRDRAQHVDRQVMHNVDAERDVDAQRAYDEVMRLNAHRRFNENRQRLWSDLRVWAEMTHREALV